MSAHPKTVEGNELLIEVYVNIPKRVLWDILWDAGARLCPVGEESIDTAMKEPEARGSIVEWIMGEAITRECWLPKSVLKREDPDDKGDKTPEEPKDEEKSTTPQIAANVEGSKGKTAEAPAKSQRKAQEKSSSKAKKKTTSKKATSNPTSGKQKMLGLPERMRV